MSIVQIDWDQPTGNLTGTHLWTVKSVTHAIAKSGAGMLKMVFKCWAPGYTKESEHNCLIMLGGPGFAFGKPRLEALGFKGGPELDTTELIGRKVWIATIEEPDSYENREGKTVSTIKLRTDINQLSHKGYQPADNVPPGCDPKDYDTGATPF